VRFWLSALFAVAAAFTLAYVWQQWPKSRWPRSGRHSLADKNEFPELDSKVFEAGKALAYRYLPGASASYGFAWVLPEMGGSPFRMHEQARVSVGVTLAR
jgi:hypothetical protein